MSKSQSTAVMARRVEPQNSLDFFPTPPWATRALFQHVLGEGPHPKRHLQTVLDPCCGEGHMAIVLGEYFGKVEASDIFDYGYGGMADFLHPDYQPEIPQNTCIDWVIANPPFNCAVEFIRQARRISLRGVAVLVRVQFLETIGRYNDLFKHEPPTRIGFYVERVPMHRGRWVVDGKSATMYCWLVWQGGEYARAPIFIPPCRRKLTNHDDWLNFGGCVDVPKKHAAAEMLARLENDLASSTAYPLKQQPLQKVLALRGQ